MKVKLKTEEAFHFPQSFISFYSSSPPLQRWQHFCTCEVPNLFPLLVAQKVFVEMLYRDPFFSNFLWLCVLIIRGCGFMLVWR